jgi:ATP adenylyltransferase
MNTLWAPWRMKYIMNMGKKEKGCIFCTKPKQKKDKANLILFRSQHFFVIMNLFPYNNGHLLVVPYAHVRRLGDLNDEQKLNLLDTVSRCVDALEKVLRPEGFNVGLNLGRVSGAGIDKHLHFHVVPRWNGDTNFMPVLSNVKVVSESISDSYARLSGVFHGQ